MTHIDSELLSEPRHSLPREKLGQQRLTRRPEKWHDNPAQHEEDRAGGACPRRWAGSPSGRNLTWPA